MPLSPALAELAAYPFVRQDEAKAAVAARGIELLDFGMGDPSEPPPAFVRDALVAAIDRTEGYPRAVGLPELREAIAAWIERRFGVRLDQATEVIPTLGSKEAIFSLAQVVLDVPGGRDTVVVTEPGYPVPARGAAFAGARVVELPASDWSDRVAGFVAQCRLHGGYFLQQAYEHDDPLLLAHASVHLATSAARARTNWCRSTAPSSPRRRRQASPTIPI